MDGAGATAAAARYRLGPTLGSGGMGRVLLGHDAVLQRELAVKEALGPAAADRLRREARLLARLDHPSIVAIYDADLAVPWLAMRLVRGATLSEAIARGGDLAARLRLLRHLLSACEGVAHAHAAGIIHRDLKPDNILVSDLGETQVLDWGLAAEVGRGDRAANEEAAAGDPQGGDLTRAGSVLGTPRYLSPEAARGEPLDRRADVWSLGVLLWQTLAGTSPWGALAVPEMLARLRHGASPVPQDDEAAIAQVGPGLPLELLAVARRATAAEPAQRYPDARALAADLEAWLDGRHVSAHRYSRAQLLWRAVRTLRLPLAVAGVALLLVAAVVATATRQVVQERDLARAALAASQRAQAGLSAAQAVSSLEAGRGPEAELAAAAALQAEVAEADEAVARGALAQLAAGPRAALIEARQLPQCRAAVVAEDGASVLCHGDDGLALWPAGGRSPAWRVPGAMLGALIPPGDGSASAAHLLVQTGNDSVQLLRRSDGRAVGPVLAGGGPRTLRLARGVVAQPMGPRLALTELASGRQTLLPACGGALVEAVAPDVRSGWWLACSDGALWRHDGAGERRVAQTPLRAPLANATALHVDAAGTAWVASSKGHLLRLDAATAAASLAQAPDGAPLADLRDAAQRASAEAGLARPMASLIRELQPAGDWLALRGDRGEVALADPLTLRVVAQLPGAAHGNLVALAATPRGAPQLLTAGTALRRWQLPRLTAPHRLEMAEGRSVTSVCRLDDAVVVGQGPGDVQAFDPTRHAPRWHARWQSGVVKALACEPRGAAVWVAAMDDQGVVELSGADGRRQRHWPLPAPVRRLIAHGGSWLAAGIADGLWTGAGATAARVGPASADWIDLDGGDVAAGSGDAATACAVDGHSGEIAAVRGRTLQRVATVPGGRTCAIPRRGGVFAARDDRVLWLDGGAPRWSQPLPARPADLAVDGDTLAIALLDGTTQLRRAGDGRLLARLGGHGERVAALLFDPREPAILWTASWDGSLRRWHADGWRQPADTLVQAARRRWGQGTAPP